MTDRTLTRRSFLTQTLALGALGALGACAGGKGSAPSATKSSTGGRGGTTAKTQGLLKAAGEGPGGGQLYVSHQRRVVFDEAWGTARGGNKYTPATLVPWASAVKPTTCVLVLQLLERGRLALDDRVAQHIKGFEVAGKQDVTIRHCLTHTAHLGGYGGPSGLGSFDETVGRIVAAPRGMRGQAPPLGEQARYNPAGIWILAEVVRRIDGRRPFDQLVRQDVYEPCGMVDSWNGIPADRLAAYGDRVVLTGSPEEAAKPQPAGGGLGPIHDLGRFYEMLLNGGEIDGRRLLKPETVAEMTRVQAKSGLPWGFGVMINEPSRFGSTPPAGGERATGPLGMNFGGLASKRAFGHSGATGSFAFADPEHGLSYAAIGRIPATEAVYADLGLA